MQNAGNIEQELLALLREKELSEFNKKLDSQDYLIKNVIQTFPPAYTDRLAHAQEHADKIHDGDELVMVLLQLAPTDRLLFAQEQAKKIQDDLQLDKVLNTLPKDSRLLFIAAISNDLPLVVFFQKLMQCSATDRLSFANEHVGEMIYNGDQLVIALQILLDTDRLSFAQTHVSKIHNGRQLIGVLETLPRNHQLPFIQFFQGFRFPMFNNSAELAYVLKILPEADQLQFANKHVKSIDCINDLITVLENIPRDNRLKFAQDAITTQNLKITYSNQWRDILKMLVKKDQLQFAHEQAEQIANTVGYNHDDCPELVAVFLLFFETFSPQDRLLFVEKHANKIQNLSNFLNILNKLNKASYSTKLSFIRTAKHIKKGDGYQLAAIIKDLSPTDKLLVADENADKIHDTHQLICVLETLKNVPNKADLLSFLKKYLTTKVPYVSKINRAFDLVDVLKVIETLPDTNHERLALANEYAALICERTLNYVLKGIPQTNRVAFTEKLIAENRLNINEWQWCEILETFPEADRLPFAHKHPTYFYNWHDAPYYCNRYFLCALDALLPTDHDQSSFVNDLAKTVKNTSDFAAALDKTPLPNHLQLLRKVLQLLGKVLETALPRKKLDLERILQTVLFSDQVQYINLRETDPFDSASSSSDAISIVTDPTSDNITPRP